MRLFETLLLIANFIAFLVLVIPLAGTLHCLRYLVPIVLLIAIVQISLEGMRWQMVPAYVITGLLLIGWFIQHQQLMKSNYGSSWQRILIIVFGLFGLAVAFLLPIIIPVFHIPRPSGPYDIGTLTYHWKDGDRTELYTEEPNDYRELMVQIWYPANGSKSSHRTHYVQDAKVLTPLARLLDLPGFIFGHLKYITTNAMEAVPVADGEASYPVLIFSHGRGGFRQHNTLQIEELVSNGYIVASIDHTYASSGVVFPDGHMVALDPRMLDRIYVDSMIPYLAQDAVFTLNQLEALNLSDPNGVLTGKLDLQRAGIFGLSLGGEVVAEACLIEPRFKSCLVMDVWMPHDVVQEGLRQPTMWISRDAETMRLEGWSEEDINETLSSMRAVFEKLPTNGYFVQVPGMFHQDFSDAPLLSPLTSWLGITGPINQRLAHDIIGAYSLAFFDRHLRGRPEKLLEGGTAQYQDVIIETHTPTAYK